MSEMELLAAMIAGDRWLSAEACAAHLGMFLKKSGRPNLRRFHERVACHPDFPKMNPVTRSWRKSDVDDWAAETSRAA